MTIDAETPLHAGGLHAVRIAQRVEVNRAVQELADQLPDTLHDGSKSLTKDDVEAVRRAILNISPPSADNYQTHAHTQLAAKMGRRIASALGMDETAQNVAEVLLLAHDGGRFLTHRGLRNDLLLQKIVKALNVRPDLLEGAPDILLDPKKSAEAIFEGMSSMQRVVVAADLCGKRRYKDWDILTYDQVLEYHAMSRKKAENASRTDRSGTFPSERRVDVPMIEKAGKLYVLLRNWLADDGILVDDLRADVLEEERQSGVKHIIFDVGDVLIPNPDPQIIRALSTTLSLDEAVVETALIETAKPWQLGRISDDEFWNNFERKLDKSLSDDQRKALMLTGLRDINIDQEMETLLGELKGQGYKLHVLTDTVPPHLRYLGEQRNLFGQFETVMSSTAFHANKSGDFAAQSEKGLVEGENPTVAYACALTTLGAAPKSCIFIDDKPVNLEKAKGLGIRTIPYRYNQGVASLRQALTTQGIGV